MHQLLIFVKCWSTDMSYVHVHKQNRYWDIPMPNFNGFIMTFSITSHEFCYDSTVIPLQTGHKKRLVYFICHDDIIKWKHFPRYWSFVRGIHRSPVNSPHKGQWLGALMFSLICFWINSWVNNREAGDLRRHRAHYDVIVMPSKWRKPPI